MKKPNEEIADLLDDLDPPYESLDELRIGRVLDRYEIPFFYKQPTIVYHEGKNEIIKPSFTMFSCGGTIIDYLQESTPEKQLEKTELYQYNRIPAVVLGPQDLGHRGWDQKLYNSLKSVYQERFDPMAYVSQDVRIAEQPRKQ
jgi:hypothetical protein